MILYLLENGSIWTPSKLTEIVTDMIDQLNIPDPTAYSNYSIRIGATSLGYQQGIDILK